MEKKPSKSIFYVKCLKKFLLTSGVVLFLLTQNAIPLLAESNVIVRGSDGMQKVKVTGRVVDASGNAMTGVNVVEKGTINGNITEADGTFAITVASSNSIIVFSFIGYDPQEVVVGNQASLNITLKETTTGLNEVVVIGYGTAKRKDVTGSIASINGSEVRDIPAANITSALQGRISGVQMDQTSTKPGATLQIRIRGTRSLNADNDPLVVIDGIPFSGSISDIPTSSIKSIDILKDAASTAIYGSRGANGVIMITTNKGYVGQKAQITYSGYAGIKDVFARYPMMNGKEFAALRTYANLHGTQHLNTADESDDTNTDWQKLLYKTGFVTSHDLSIAGGSDAGSYNFGAGYYRDEAVVPLQDYTRYSIHSSLDQQIGKYLRIGFNTTSNYAVTNGNSLGAVGNAVSYSPIANIYNDDGSLKERFMEATSGATWVSTRKTLDALGDKYINQNRAFATYNSLYGEVKIPGIEGLKYRLNLGLDYRQSNDGSYTGVGVFSGTASNNSVASIGNAHTLHWEVENLLTYDRTFAEKHQINFVALYSAEQKMYNSSSISVKDIPMDAFEFYNLGQATGDKTINPNYQYYTLQGLESYMGRLMYSYAGKYMISVMARSDGSSVLATGHKWHTYPAISAGWNITEEPFMKSISQIDQLKLRVGYGETSNQAISPYSTLGTCSTRPYNFGASTYRQGLYVSKLPNPDLGWEYSQTYNIGLDFALLKNRLSGTIELYKMDTHDVLLDLTLPSTSGVSTYTANIGKTQNKGIEFTLNGTILDNYNGWTWDAGINIYANRNKLVALASGNKRDESNWWFVGHPIDVIYDYKKIGLWQADDQYLTDYEPGGNAGMIKVKYTGDYDADGKPTRAIGSADQQIMSLEPNFLGGFNTRIAYKGIDLSIIGTFKDGGKLISTLYGSNGYTNQLNARSGNNVKVDYWTEDNIHAKYPRPNGLGGDNPKYGSTLGYFNASYLKIRTITLGYNLNTSAKVKNLGFKTMRIYATAQNPFVFFSPYKKESGMDPETNSTADQNNAVPMSGTLKRLLTIGTNTPSTRNYLIGLELTF
jgi:TonB-dependent starch-binding outer membrane protein SusC